MKDAERRNLYAEAVGDAALERQLDDRKVRRSCCATLRGEPHEPACRVGRQQARRAR